jgi:TRAP-type C4-dicarboxylate transport system substrate-binding protein
MLGKATALGLSLGASLAVAVLPALAAEPVRWEMPTAYPDGNYHTQNAKQFAECVRASSGGALEIAVRGGGSLVRGGEIKGAVGAGRAMIGERLLSAHEGENAVFGYDAVPFLAVGFEASDRLWRAARPTLSEVLDRENLTLLYAVPWPPQGLYAKRTIEAAADLGGVSLATNDAVTARLAGLTGAVPVPVEPAQLGKALAERAAESLVASSAVGHELEVWRHLDRFYDLQASLPRSYVFANKQAAAALPEPVRAALADCAQKAELHGTAEARRLAGWHLDQFRERGMAVLPPGDRLRADLARIGEAATAEWLARAGEDGRAIVEAYRQM